MTTFINIDNNKTDENCAICLENININNNSITLECQHRYCKSCIDNLFSSNYITPIINEKNARKYAAKQLFSLKKNPNFKKLSEKIYLQHGSRKSIINKK